MQILMAAFEVWQVAPRSLLPRVGAGLLALLLTVTLSTGAFAQSTGSATSEASAAAAPVSGVPGVLIVEVQPASPADEAGLERGDILLTFDGEEVDDAFALIQAIAAVELDADDAAEVEISWRHGAETRTATVTLGQQDGVAFLGIRPYLDGGRGLELRLGAMDGSGMMGGLTMARPGMGGMMGEPMMLHRALLDDLEGVAILEVVADSPAANAELVPGDIIVAFNGEPIRDPAAFQSAVQALAPDDTITLEVISHSALRAAVTTTIGTAVDSDTDAATDADAEAEADLETEGDDIDDAQLAGIETRTVTIVLAASPDDEDVAFLGVSLLPLGQHLYRHMGTMDESDMMHPFHRGGSMMAHPGMDGMMGQGMMGRGMMGQGTMPGAGADDSTAAESGRMMMWHSDGLRRDGMGSDGWGSQSRFGRFLIWGMNKLHEYGFNMHRVPVMRHFVTPGIEVVPAQPAEPMPQFRMPLAPRSSDFF